MFLPTLRPSVCLYVSDCKSPPLLAYIRRRPLEALMQIVGGGVRWSAWREINSWVVDGGAEARRLVGGAVSDSLAVWGASCRRRLVAIYTHCPIRDDIRRLTAWSVSTTTPTVQCRPAGVDNSSPDLAWPRLSRAALYRLLKPLPAGRLMFMGTRACHELWGSGRRTGLNRAVTTIMVHLGNRMSTV